MVLVSGVVLGWERSLRVVEEQFSWMLVAGIAVFVVDLVLRRAAGPLERLAARRRAPVVVAGWALFLGSPLLLFAILDAPDGTSASISIVLVLAASTIGIHLLVRARR